MYIAIHSYNSLKWPQLQSQNILFFKIFLQDMPPDSLTFACFACWVKACWVCFTQFSLCVYGYPISIELFKSVQVMLDQSKFASSSPDDVLVLYCIQLSIARVFLHIITLLWFSVYNFNVRFYLCWSLYCCCSYYNYSSSHSHCKCDCPQHSDSGSVTNTAVWSNYCERYHQ